MKQFHMCGWINYIEEGSARNRSILSYAVEDQPADLLWQIQSETETRVRIGSNNIDFTNHTSLSGNVSYFCKILVVLLFREVLGEL